ncbi:MAG: glycosyltransferase N-terminal domain-containing protein [Ginsengibacter sp.]
MIFLYHLFLDVYSGGIRLASLWNKKARSWVSGRTNYFDNLKSSYSAKPGKRIWMHCASLGEFEQGRPVLTKIKDFYPEATVIITFFSPSGYDIVKDNPEFDHVYYLPIDSPGNARKLVDILNPDLVLWIKYEYWHYYLRELKNRKIPVLLISGVFLKNQPFFKWYGKFWRKMLEGFSHFFVQNEASKQQLLQLVPGEKITVAGDTRCDRVINISRNFVDVPGIPEFCGSSTVVVAGSTWEDDEAEWIHFVKQHPDIKFIVAPHEVNAENIAEVNKGFAGSITYSELMRNASSKPPVSIPTATSNTSHCLIIDSIGMLSRLYKYAMITYVGGGFGYNGLHNILEAAVYGKPVIFGPEYEKNFEAVELIASSGAISIESALELEDVVNKLLTQPEEIVSRGAAAAKYVYNNAGASDKIMSYINGNIFGGSNRGKV